MKYMKIANESEITLQHVATQNVRGDIRQYYVILNLLHQILEPPPLLVLQSNLTLDQIYGQCCEVLVGADDALPDFVSHARYIHIRRSKVSIVQVRNEYMKYMTDENALTKYILHSIKTANFTDK